MRKIYLLAAAAVVVSAFAHCRHAQAQGIFVNGVGAVNRSMTSASVAAPISAAGALAYNPASMAGLESSETEVGLELLWADMSVESEVQA